MPKLGSGFPDTEYTYERNALIAVASIILAEIEVSFPVLLNFMALPFAGVPGLIAAHGFGVNPLIIWIGIGAVSRAE
jgi:NaMN:DMB phosphoribosyltransferase